MALQPLGGVDSAARFERVKLIRDGEGNARSVAQVGSNPVLLCHSHDGALSAFKSMEPVDVSWEQPLREEAAREVVASRLMHALGVNTLVYRDAVADVGGQDHRGLASEFIVHQTLQSEPAAIERLRDPDAAVRAGVFDAWMGNFDRIANDGNLWMQPDGAIIYGDYGFAFRDGVTACGVPKVNQRLFMRWATSENVGPALEEVQSLSDQEIRGLVEAASAASSTVSSKQLDGITGVLTRNRDVLRTENPFAFYLTGTRSPKHGFPLGAQASAALAQHALLQFGGQDVSSHEVASRITEVVRGFSPRQGGDVEEVSETLADLVTCHQQGVEACTLVRGHDFVAWQQACKTLLPREVSRDLGLGLQ